MTFITDLLHFVPEEMLFIRCMRVMAISTRILNTTCKMAVYLIKIGHCALVTIYTLTNYFIHSIWFALFMTIAAFLLFKGLCSSAFKRPFLSEEWGLWHPVQSAPETL